MPWQDHGRFINMDHESNKHVTNLFKSLNNFISSFFLFLSKLPLVSLPSYFFSFILNIQKCLQMKKDRDKKKLQNFDIWQSMQE